MTEQWPPFPHVPTHWPSLNSHERCARVVVVVDGPPVGGTVVVVVDTSEVGTQSSWPRRKLTTRWPPNSSVRCIAGGNGRGQRSW